MIFTSFMYLTYFIFLILTSKYSSNIKRKDMLLTYLKIKLKYLFFVLMLRQDLQKEEIFNYRVNFLNYSTFVLLFEEIFISQVYNFGINKEKPLIFDCGANVGISTLYFKIVYPNSKILAFEPDQKTYLKLKANVQENFLKNIKIINEAISDKSGTANFYGDARSLNCSLNNKRAGNISRRRVATSLLSNYINSTVDFLKIDIEGSEGKVLEELKNKGKLTFIRSGVVEYHHNIKGENDYLGNFLSLFEKSNFGYQIKSDVKFPFSKSQYQDILIFFYQKKLLLKN